MDTVSGILIVAGSALAMIGGIGAVRFRDLYSRMHAAAKAPTLGLVLVSLGAAIAIDTLLAYTTLLLVVILQLLSSPVGAHALSRAVTSPEPGTARRPRSPHARRTGGPGSSGHGLNRGPTGPGRALSPQDWTMRIDWISTGSDGVPSGVPAAAISSTVVSNPSITWPNSAYSGGSAAPSEPVTMKN